MINKTILFCILYITEYNSTTIIKTQRNGKRIHISNFKKGEILNINNSKPFISSLKKQFKYLQEWATSI